jgi:hypothetical protein
MMLKHLWRHRRCGTRSPFSGRAIRSASHLCLDLLEDRCLLSADMVLQWNDTLLDAIRVDRTPPPQASRAMAIVQAAIYEAVNSIERQYTPYLVQIPAPPGSSPEAAAAEAGHDTLAALFPAQQSRFDDKLAESLAPLEDGPAKGGGIEVGHAAAQILLAVRSHDGSTATVTYIPGSQPGVWQPTAPGYLPAFDPQWANLVPFCMTSDAAFRPAGPPALDSADYQAALQEVRDLGAINSHARTFDQTVIALFWGDAAGTVTPPGHWNLIAHTVAEAQGNTLMDNARLFALLDLAMGDAAIVAWDAKFTYNFWRPITAIRHDLDPSWEPLIVTSPFPTYVSGHSAFSSAAAAVLGSFFGTDSISFATTSDALPRTTRSFSSFTQAANEVGRCPIYAGFHFEFDNRDGSAAGTALGQYVSANFLLPLAQPPTAARRGGHLAADVSVLLPGALPPSFFNFSSRSQPGIAVDDLKARPYLAIVVAGGPARASRLRSIGAASVGRIGRAPDSSPYVDLLFGAQEWREGRAFAPVQSPLLSPVSAACH